MIISRVNAKKYRDLEQSSHNTTAMIMFGLSSRVHKQFIFHRSNREWK